MRMNWFRGIVCGVLAAAIGAAPAKAQLTGGVFICTNCCNRAYPMDD